MATANTTFTQEQIDNLSGVAKKYGGFDNANFQSAVDGKYGAGSFDSLKTSLSAINTRQKAEASMVPPTPTPFVPNPAENPQTALEAQRNKEQAAFNAANPVGTKTEDIAYTAPSDIMKAEDVAKQETASNAPKTDVSTPQAMVAPKAGEDAKMEQIKAVSEANRRNEILGNLNEGYKNDPSINKAITTGDYETYKKAYEYDTADEQKRKMLDAYFQARQPKDEAGIYNVLKTGATIANPELVKSGEFAKAKAKADMFAKFNGMGASQLLTELKNGNIGTEMDKELEASPNYQLAKKQWESWKTTNGINEKAKASMNVLTGKQTTEQENKLTKL